jgi:hypothetical protein
MFADDTFCAKSKNNLKTLMQYDNGEINKMAVWFRANKLAVNVNITKYMIFHKNSNVSYTGSPIVSRFHSIL